MKKSEYKEFLKLLVMTDIEFCKCLEGDRNPPDSYCETECTYRIDEPDCNYTCWKKYLDLILEKD